MNDKMAQTKTSSSKSFKNNVIDNNEDFKKDNILPIENENENENNNKDTKLKNKKYEDKDVDRLKIENWIFYIKIFVVLFIIGSGILTVCFFGHLKAAFIHFIEFLKGNILLGSLILICIKILGTILYIPGILLAIASGYGYAKAFGNNYQAVPVGVFVMMLGSALGCCVVFWLSRTLIKSCLFPVFNKIKYFRALDKALIKRGNKINLLLRMSPIIPYNVMNYFLGVTSTEFLNYLFGLIGFIPLVVCYVYLGTTIEDLSNYSFAKSQKNPYELVVMIVSIIISVVCILIVTHMAKQELDIEIAQEDLKSNSGMSMGDSNADNFFMENHLNNNVEKNLDVIGKEDIEITQKKIK